MILAEVGQTGLVTAQSRLKKVFDSEAPEQKRGLLTPKKSLSKEPSCVPLSPLQLLDTPMLSIPPTTMSAVDNKWAWYMALSQKLMDGTASFQETVEVEKLGDVLAPCTDSRPSLNRPCASICELTKLDTSDALRFNIDNDAWLTHLNEHSYAVIKEVASLSERKTAMALLWGFLHEHAGFDPHDARSWSDENFERIGLSSKGIIDCGGICQSDLMWHLQLLPKVRRAFTKIWKTERLLTSFDAANIFWLWQFQDPGLSKMTSGWYHIDQGKGMPGLEAVQGLVSLLDVDATTGGFVVWLRPTAHDPRPTAHGPRPTACGTQAAAQVVQHGRWCRVRTSVFNSSLPTSMTTETTCRTRGCTLR